MGLLDGRTIAITGAGRGIGASTAQLCAELGASVVVNDLGVGLDGRGVDDSPGASVVDLITGSGCAAVLNTADIATAEGGASLIRTALDTYGRLDVLVNCAGILRDRMIFNMDEAEWDAVLRVHLNGCFNTIKPAAAYWRAHPSSDHAYRLINFTSVSGLFGAPGQPNYAAAKTGVVGLTYSCANALAKYGVTANAISPGANTRMTASIPGKEQVQSVTDPERDPRNVATVVAYLASDRASWCTGQVIEARGYQVGLYNKPALIRHLIGTSPWDVDSLGGHVEAVFRPAIETIR